MNGAVSSLAGWMIRATLGTGGRLRCSEAMMDGMLRMTPELYVVLRCGEKREEVL